MPNNQPRTGKRPLRGGALDQALTRELESMIAEGLAVSPISVSAVARRLALGSRTTLYEPPRLERIHAAEQRQRQLSGRENPAKQAEHEMLTRTDLQQLRRQLNELRGYVVQIAINAHRMGLQPELLLALSQREMKTTGSWNPHQLVMQYLAGIGLLTKLDANVRGLSR